MAEQYRVFDCSFSRPLRHYRRAALQLGTAFTSMADSDPGHRKARAIRVGQQQQAVTDLYQI
jgi:hypothetical protein